MTLPQHRECTRTSDLAFRAMEFARNVHRGQTRKYSGVPYFDHLAEVAGIVASVGGTSDAIAAAWLHDVVEDQGVEVEQIAEDFGRVVSAAVQALSDLEVGNRATRKAASRDRLAKAPGWVQTIKLADLISNTSSIVQHDPQFAKTYLAEKRALLLVMRDGDPRLWRIASELASQDPTP